MITVILETKNGERRGYRVKRILDTNGKPYRPRKRKARRRPKR